MCYASRRTHKNFDGSEELRFKRPHYPLFVNELQRGITEGVLVVYSKSYGRNMQGTSTIAIRKLVWVHYITGSTHQPDEP